MAVIVAIAIGVLALGFVVGIGLAAYSKGFEPTPLNSTNLPTKAESECQKACLEYKKISAELSNLTFQANEIAKVLEEVEQLYNAELTTMAVMAILSILAFIAAAFPLLTAALLPFGLAFAGNAVAAFIALALIQNAKNDITLRLDEKRNEVNNANTNLANAKENLVRTCGEANAAACI